MPDAEPDSPWRSSRVLTGMFWSGAGLAPLAGLLLLVSNGGALRLAGVLAVAAVVLIGMSLALRPDSSTMRLQLEETLLDEIDTLGQQIADSGLTAAQLVGTAWASACTFRQTDYRGGANGARIRLEPQAGWDVNVRSGVSAVIKKLEEIKEASDANISLADLIVLGGCVGVEMAARAAGHEVTVPFSPGRTDATQEMTEVDTFQYLEPKHDAFRNYLQKETGIPAEHLMVDRAFMLNLTAPEMTALIGGMRAIGANAGDDNTDGVLTDRPGQLTNDFFVNLVDMGTVWSPIGEGEARFEGRDRKTGESKWTATRVDLVFGSNSQLRAIAEEYAANGGEKRMIDAFVKGFVKVMDNDRFDLHR
jgi:catalase-peroxidase